MSKEVVDYTIKTKDNTSSDIFKLANNIMKITCNNYGLINDCHNCTTKMSNEFIDNCQLVKSCYKSEK